MSPEEAKSQIVSQIKVTRQRVGIAKAYALKHFNPDTLKLIDQFTASMNAEFPEKLVLHPSIDPSPQISAIAEAISWKLSACEAVWGLISAGVIFPASNNLRGEIGSISWTTMIPGSGGQSSGFSLDELSVSAPIQLVRSKALDAHDQPLSDPDLYLKELNLPNLSSEIEFALREAVKCLRHDLHLACLAMLGRASEAAWIETGLALAKFGTKQGAPQATKAMSQLEDQFVGIGKKIQIVTDLYSKQDVFGPLAKTSGVTLQDLRNGVVWADCVRESRNSIHYGATPSMSNSYEKIVALLIGAVPTSNSLFNLARQL